MSNPRRKLVVVGDGACGKTCLLHVFAQGDFPRTHIPTLFDTSCALIKVNNQLVELSLWDTAGQEDYDRLRPLSYSDTNVIILCFSVNNPDSLDNILVKWSPELCHYCQDVPVILVGNKTDLREESSTMEDPRKENQETVTFKEGLSMAQQIDAAAYMECSAKNNEGVSEVFERATLISLQPRKKMKPGSKCCIF